MNSENLSRQKKTCQDQDLNVFFTSLSTLVKSTLSLCQQWEFNLCNFFSTNIWWDTKIHIFLRIYSQFENPCFRKNSSQKMHHQFPHPTSPTPTPPSSPRSKIGSRFIPHHPELPGNPGIDPWRPRMRQRPASEDAKGLEAKLPLTNFWGGRTITKIWAA